MKKKLILLTSFWFIFGLVLLLLNDFVLKGVYHNWLTGKLSDVAGLFVFSLFWCAIFPKQQNKVFLTVGILFVFWKSTYSQPLIDSWNWVGIFKINRVVDFSDLIALLILPLAFEYSRRKDQLLKINIHPAFPLLMAAFSFCATSSTQQDFDFNKKYKFSVSKSELIKKMNTLNSWDSIPINPPLSLSLHNSNDYKLDFNDTLWYYSLDADTIYDTIYKYKEVFKPNKFDLFEYVETDEIDAINEYIHSTTDTMYVNQNGIVYYRIHQKEKKHNSDQYYFYTVTAKLKIKGQGSSSSITLKDIYADSFGDDWEVEKKKLLADFERFLIKKLRKI